MSRRVLGLSLVSLVACAPENTGSERGEAVHPDLYRFDTSRSQGFEPNPDFVPIVPEIATKRSALSIEGEIVVVEGDAMTVSQAGIGRFGISEDNQRVIVSQVLSLIPDEFDTIQIYTTFTDQAHAGFAYYQGIRNDVQGIGKMTFNARPMWGLAAEGGRLSGFSNMNSMLMWGGGSFDGLNTVEGFYHGVIAHELSHRWLFNMRFTDVNGMPNASLLGRDDAHWSRLAHAYGSVHDGNWFVDNGDGSFTNMGTDLGFAPLDLYAMGRLTTDEVEDFFYLVEARNAAGDPLNKLSGIAAGETITGNPVEVTIGRVVDAMGPRDPAPLTELPYYRAAFVLVTEPGQPRSEWEPHLTALSAVAQDFPTTWHNWTGGAMCTKVTERCPEPIIVLGDYGVQDDGDEIIAPGETFSVTVFAQNNGVGTAEGVTVEIVALSDTVTVQTGPQAAPPLPSGERVQVPTAFMLTASSTIGCDVGLRMAAQFTTVEGPVFREVFEVGVGSKRLRYDPLNEAPDWTVNPDSDDTATSGIWALGEPEEGGAAGVLTQPGQDHTPGDAKLAFFTGPDLMSFFSSNDVDNGRTTLESPIFALTAAEDPSLEFYAWRVAMDFTQSTGPEELEGAPLIVQVSNDGGDTYEELGRFTENTEEWTRVSFNIRDVKELTDRMRFRFVIEDVTASGTVEAGIDDLAVVDFLELCGGRVEPTPDGGVRVVEPPDDGGCGCSETAGTSSTAALSALALLALLGFARRRRDSDRA